MHKMTLNKPSARIALAAALVISILLGVWFTVGSSLTTTAQSSNGNLVENEFYARVEDLGGQQPRPYLMVTRENVGGEIKTKLDYLLSIGPGYHGEIPNEYLTAKGLGNIVLHIDDTSTIPGQGEGSIHIEWNKIPGPWCSIVYWETWHYPDGSIESSRYTEKVYPAEAQGTAINWTLDGIDEQAEIRCWQAIE